MSEVKPPSQNVATKSKCFFIKFQDLQILVACCLFWRRTLSALVWLVDRLRLAAVGVPPLVRSLQQLREVGCR